MPSWERSSPVSVNDYARLIAPLRAAAVRAAWTQWASLGFGASASRTGHAIVDPEALVLASLALRDEERRLDHVMKFWLADHVRLLSASRLANLVGDYPASVRRSLADLAVELVRAGDPRWRRLAAGVAGRRRAAVRAERSREPSTIPLRDRTTILLRLRVAIGVGIKSDVLALLIGLAESRQTVRQMSLALGYQERALRRAVEDLAWAGLVTQVATAPVSYMTRLGTWAELFGFDAQLPPLWRYWRELFAVVVQLQNWAASADASWSPYVAASRLRDLMEGMDPLLVRALVRERPDWTGEPTSWAVSFGEWAGRFEHRLEAVT